DMLRRILAVLAICSATDAIACRCNNPGVEEALENADLAVIGTVAEQAPLAGEEGTVAIVAIEQHWSGHSTKGKQPARKIGVISITNCHFSWTKETRYLTSLTRDDHGLYSTIRCHGNRPASEAGKDIEWLKQHR